MNEHIKLFLDQLGEAQDRYDEADSYFRGVPEEVWSSPKLRAALGITGNETAFKENYSAVPVKAMAARMNLSGFNVPGNDDATDFLSQLWTDSKMNLEFHGFLRDCCKYGEGFIEIDFADIDGQLTVDICPVDVKRAQLVYSPDDMREKLFFGKLNRIPSNYYGTPGAFVNQVTLKYADRIEVWVQENPESENYLPQYYVEDELGNDDWEDNPLGEVPAYHFRNETPFGVPEHIDTYGAQDQLVKIILNEMSVLQYVGLPARYTIMNDDATAGAAFGVPGQGDAGLKKDETKAPSPNPDDHVLIKGKATGTYAAADVTQLINAKKDIKESMAVLSDTPIRYFTDPGGAHPSGDSLRAADARFKAKILNRQEMYAETLAEVFKAALVLAGFVDTEEPVINWKPQIMEQDKSLFEIVKMKIDLGIPKYVAFLEAGYEEDLDWMKALKAEYEAALTVNPTE